MSITAEKIEEALAYLESEYSIKECCGHPVGGNGPEDEPACCAQPDLYLRSDKVKETILSLLQQGEPDGWKLVPKKPTERMRQRGGEYNCPTITLTSASNYAVDVYAAMIEVAPTFPVMVSEPNDTANHDGADHVGRTGGSIPPTGAMLSASPLPPAPGAETGGRRLGTAEALQFSDFRKLPEGVRKHFEEIEIFLSDVDGKDLATFTEDSAIDDGTIDCEGVVRAVNAIAAWVQSSSRQAVLEEAKDSERAILLARVVGFAVGSAAAEEHAGLISEFERLGFVARRKHYSKVGSWEAYALTDSGFDHLERIASRNLTQRCLRAHIFYLRNATTPPAEGETK